MRQPDNIEIIRRYFQGKLIDIEYEYLNNFLRYPGNKEIFEEEKQKWIQAPEMDDLVIRNWYRLHYKINKDQSKANNYNLKNIWIKVASVAAFLLIGLLLGGLLTTSLSTRNNNYEILVFETPRGEKSKVILPDGSKVWLNANSRLVYHSFANAERKVELAGEAYFEVVHSENIPFVVKTTDCDITVLGTKFNVMAYKDFGRNEITLIEGSVKVNSVDSQKVLNPGQMLILEKNNMVIEEVNSSLFTGWVENKFNFRNIPLTELIKRLENWYDLDITLENKTGKEVNFTGTFKNEETIWQVLDAIKIYVPIRYEKTNLRKIKITVM